MVNKTFLHRALCLILSLLLMASPLAAAPATPNRIRVLLDGQDVTASCAPVTQNGRTLVPVRFISEQIGAYVTWDGATQTVTVTKGDKTASLRIGSRLVGYNDGAVYNLSDVTPQIINNLTYVPLRLIGNALGIGVGWVESTNSVVVNSSQPTGIAAFYPVRLTSPAPGADIMGETSVRVSVPTTLSASVAEMKLMLLDPITGKGLVVAAAREAAGELTFLPRIEDQGTKVLVLACYNAAGAFIGGDAVPVNIEVIPQVMLTGISPAATVSDTITFGQTVNYLTPYVQYTFTQTATGKVTTIEQQDPQGSYTWTPTLEQNGEYTITVAAFDGNGNLCATDSMNVTVALERQLSLTGVTQGMTISQPVSLLANRNFNVSETQYLIRDVATGVETILATIPYGSYAWFPGPDSSGAKELSVRVKDTRGDSYTSSPVRVNVDGSPKVRLQGVGPQQVVTEALSLSVRANVPLDSLNYILTNTATGAKTTIASAADLTAKYTTAKADGTALSLQAVGTWKGVKVTSETIAFKAYHGTVYGPKAIVPKEEFLDLAAGLAKASAAKTGMSTALQTAQAILETGWGQKVPVDKYSGKLSNNLFGIKGTGPKGSVTSSTWEVYNGVTYTVDAAFRAYNNVSESWADRNNLLLTSARYAPFRAVMYDSTLGAWAIKRSGYATDPLYPVKLLNLIKTYGLMELDQVGI